MLCSFEGCTKNARGSLCPAHYQQKRHGKELKPLQVQYHGLTEETRLLKRIATTSPNECWPWTGAVIKKGWHGEWRNAAGEVELVHRAAWRLFKSQIPDGMCICHRCDNPICCNPSHLFLGTKSENLLDMWAKGRAKPQRVFGEKHGMSKLTAELVLEIRSSKESGVELARRLKLTPTTICDVRKRRSWKHIV